MQMRLELTLTQKVLVLVAVPLVFELAFIGLLAFRLYQSEREVEREAHARTIISAQMTLLKRSST